MEKINLTKLVGDVRDGKICKELEWIMIKAIAQNKMKKVDGDYIIDVEFKIDGVDYSFYNIMENLIQLLNLNIEKVCDEKIDDKLNDKLNDIFDDIDDLRDEFINKVKNIVKKDDYSDIDKKVKELMSITSNFIFIEHYSHEGCDCFKILNEYTEYRKDKLVLCRVDEGIGLALDRAIEDISKRKASFVTR